MVSYYAMSILSVRDLNKSFGIETALEGVSFTVNKGDRIGVVGANGAGKSTLFKIIVGELAADSGEIAAAKDLTVGYLRQREHFPEEGTVLDTMLMLGDEPAAKRGSASTSTTRRSTGRETTIPWAAPG